MMASENVANAGSTGRVSLVPDHDCGQVARMQGKGIRRQAVGGRKPYWKQTGREKKAEKSVLATIQTTNRHYSEVINKEMTGTGQPPGPPSYPSDSNRVFR